MALGACRMNKKVTSTLDLPITKSPLDRQFATLYAAYGVHEMLECHQKNLFRQLQTVSRTPGGCFPV